MQEEPRTTLSLPQIAEVFERVEHCKTCDSKFCADVDCHYCGYNWNIYEVFDAVISALPHLRELTEKTEAEHENE